MSPQIIWIVNENTILPTELAKQFELLDENLRPDDFVLFEKMINFTSTPKDELILNIIETRLKTKSLGVV